MTAQYYLYKNTADWTLEHAPSTDNQNVFTTHWEIVPKKAVGKSLLEKGEVYSMIFPYCMGCFEREWDYWSGKYIIFESTKGSVTNPHVISGKSALENEFTKQPVLQNTAYLTGNKTFAHASSESSDIYTYLPDIFNESAILSIGKSRISANSFCVYFFLFLSSEINFPILIWSMMFGLLSGLSIQLCLKKEHPRNVEYGEFMRILRSVEFYNLQYKVTISSCFSQVSIYIFITYFYITK